MQAICLLVGVALAGQSSVPAPSRLHAIVDARVEVGDGTVLERATVVVQDGYIVAVAPDAAVPKGAEVLPGKGLTVYPGFIDAYTTRGVKTPPAQPNQDDAPPSSEVADAAMREANRKQVRPELEARMHLDLSEAVRKPYLEAGFTTIMAVPEGNGIKGQGTLVNLSGRAPRESVVIPKTGLAVAFGPSQGSDVTYPVSLLGSIAQFRQAILDANLHAAASVNRLRPPSDPTLEALAQATKRRFFVEADSTAEIDRANRLAKELNLRATLVGTLQAWRRLDAFRTTSLILGLEPGTEPKAPETPKESESDRQDDPGNDPDDSTRLGERVRYHREALANPGVLAKAGVPFALTTRGAKDVPAFVANLRRAVAQGLPRAAALRALTTDAAALYGQERLFGKVQPGMAANVAVMTGDFLDEKTKVKMLYIDGWRIDPAARPTTPAAPQPQGRKELR